MTQNINGRNNRKYHVEQTRFYVERIFCFANFTCSSDSLGQSNSKSLVESHYVFPGGVEVKSLTDESLLQRGAAALLKVASTRTSAIEIAAGGRCAPSIRLRGRDQKAIRDAAANSRREKIISLTTK